MFTDISGDQHTKQYGVIFQQVWTLKTKHSFFFCGLFYDAYKKSVYMK
jgi:hypothetical protein